MAELLERYTTLIQCPEHPYDAHEAVLFQRGHQYSGIWECPMTGNSDACEHKETTTEMSEVDTLDSQGEHTTYDVQLEVCIECDETVGL